LRIYIPSNAVKQLLSFTDLPVFMIASVDYVNEKMLVLQYVKDLDTAFRFADSLKSDSVKVMSLGKIIFEKHQNIIFDNPENALRGISFVDEGIFIEDIHNVMVSPDLDKLEVSKV
jgi:hypothetical protein